MVFLLRSEKGEREHYSKKKQTGKRWKIKQSSKIPRNYGIEEKEIAINGAAVEPN